MKNFHSPFARRRSASGNRVGATTVEMALVLPAFLTLIFGCMEFSRLSMIRSTSANAAYEAARFAMVQGGDSDDANEKATEVLEMLGVSDTTTTVRFLDEDENVVPTIEATRVRVQVDVPYLQNSLFSAFLPESFYGVMISSRVTLRTNVNSNNTD